MALTLDKKSVSRFNEIDSKTKNLVSSAAHRFVSTRIDASIDYDDILQALRLQLWRIVKKYSDKSDADLLKIYKQAIWYEVFWRFRVSRLKKNKHINVSINSDGTQEDQDKFVDQLCFYGQDSQQSDRINKVLSIKNGDSEDTLKKDFLDYLIRINADSQLINLYKTVAFLSDSFIKFCKKSHSGKNGTNFINLKNTAKYFKINNNKLHEMLTSLKQHYGNFQLEESKIG